MKAFAKEYFAFRAGVYALLVGIIFQSIVWMAKSRGWDSVAREGGYVESFQTFLIALSAVALAALSLRSRSLRPLFAILAFLAAAAVFREFNNEPWYRTIFPPIVKGLIGLAALGGLVFCFRRELPGAIKLQLTRPSSILFAIGFAIVTVWAQTLAQKELWPFLQDRLLEESLELAGYCLITCGIIEAFVENTASRDPSAA